MAVHAASITPDELTWEETWKDGRGPAGRDRTPIVPSHEMSGVVADLGPEVTEVEVGDEVYCLIPFARDGAAAEFVSVPAAVLAHKPVTIDHDTAAAIPLAALTAWQALVDHAALKADHHVLIHGAAGGVGSFAVQIAADLGARVTATARESDRDFVQGLGAADVVDYEHDRFEDRVDGVDVVLDPVGGPTQARSWSVLRPGGVLVSVAAPPDPGEAAKHGARGGVLRRRAGPRSARDDRAARRQRTHHAHRGSRGASRRYAGGLRGPANRASPGQGRPPRRLTQRCDPTATHMPPEALTRSSNHVAISA